MSCQCGDNVTYGGYENYINIDAPPHMPKENGYSVHVCLKDEILNLWSFGINTTGCCCGHNKEIGYIGVIDSDIEKMKMLGYQICFNPCRPKDQDSFIPKSI